jgi:hypothetical protein
VQFSRLAALDNEPASFSPCLDSNLGPGPIAPPSTITLVDTYTQALKLPRSTSNLLVFLEMGQYPMQIQLLQRTLSYWNKLVANKAESELLDFVLAAEVW